MRKNNRLVQNLFRGYARIGTGAAAFLAVAVAIVLTAVVIVWPLWFAATHARVAYTAAGIGLLVVLAVVWTVRRRRHRHAAHSDEENVRRSSRLIALALLLAILACIYLSVLLFISGPVLAGIVPAVAALALIGLLGAPRRRKGRSGAPTEPGSE